MGRNLLKISIVVLSLLLASASSAEELIQNGGFESGDLFPWEKIGEYNTWTVTDDYAYEGTYSGFVQGSYQVAQSFEPRPGSNIEVFSITVMTAMSAWVTVEVDYNDEMDSTRASFYIGTPFEWQTLDLIEHIDPDREVNRVVLSGHQSGDSPSHLRTWYDAVTIQNNTPDEPPEVVEVDEVIQAETKRIRVRFNLRQLRTHLSLALRAEDLPDGIQEGPVDIRVLLTQNGFTTEFEAVAEFVEVPHKKEHIILFMDEASAEKGKAKH